VLDDDVARRAHLYYSWYSALSEPARPKPRASFGRHETVQPGVVLVINNHRDQSYFGAMPASERKTKTGCRMVYEHVSSCDSYAHSHTHSLIHFSVRAEEGSQAPPPFALRPALAVTDGVGWE
jgi:hypothetical protein